MFIVYMLTNEITEKSYIGLTGKSLDVRWKEHVSLSTKISNRKLYNSIKKHGHDIWDQKVLLYCDSMDEAKEYEILLISEFDTFNAGYNSTLGGDGTCGGGWKLSNSTKSKMSVYRKGRKMDKYTADLSPETILKRTKHMKGNHYGSKGYVIIDPDGVEIVVKDITSFMKEIFPEKWNSAVKNITSKKSGYKYKNYSCKLI